MIKPILFLVALVPSLVSAHPLTLDIHMNDGMHSSGSMQCKDFGHCQYLIKSFEYKSQENCAMFEVKDRNRVIYRKYYNNH